MARVIDHDVGSCGCCKRAVDLGRAYVTADHRPPCACHLIDVREDLAASFKAGAKGDHSSVAGVLRRAFREESLRKLFGHNSIQDAILLNCGGMNHVFMVVVGKLLAKCTRPKSAAFSECLEAERLRSSAQGFEKDPHAVFPRATFLCKEAGKPSPEGRCEILLFDLLEGCVSLADLVRSFERSHQLGVLQSTAQCEMFRARGDCDHVALLRSLVVRQAVCLGRRFQALYGRRHGDFKADNVLLDSSGRARLADFLSPFCRSCDRDEFMTSLQTMHPTIQEMRSAFEQSWRQTPCEGADLWEPCRPILNECLAGNLRLIEELGQMAQERKGKSIFGPMPSIFDKMQSLLPSDDGERRGSKPPLPPEGLAPIQIAELPRPAIKGDFTFSVTRDVSTCSTSGDSSVFMSATLSGGSGGFSSLTLPGVERTSSSSSGCFRPLREGLEEPKLRLGSPQRCESPGPKVSAWLQKPVGLPPQSKLSVPTPSFVPGMSPLARGRDGYRSCLDLGAGAHSFYVAQSYAVHSGGWSILLPQVQSSWPSQAYNSQIPAMGQSQPVTVVEEPKFYFGQQTLNLSPEFGSFFVAAPPQSPVLPTPQAVMMCPQTPPRHSAYQRSSVTLPPAGSLQSPRPFCWESGLAPSPPPFVFHKTAGVPQSPKPGELGSPYGLSSPLTRTGRCATSPYRSHFPFR